MKIDRIRKLVTANHGGMENASDGEIKEIWKSLPEDVKEKYIKKEKANKDADSK